MGKNFTAAFAVCLAISSLPLACGDDEDDPSGNGKGGSAGDGTGGKATGGTAGKGTGGTSGTGTGGSAGKATGGSAGKATGGTAGTAGIGGADGGVGGAEGGMGGEGGAPVMSVCERLCVAAQVANCSAQAGCVQTCEDAYLYGGADCRDEMDALWECAIVGPAANWSCDLSNNPGYAVDECPTELAAALDMGCI